MGKPPEGIPPEINTTNQSVIARWREEEFFDKGFVATPVRFLELYAHLKPHALTPGEALFVLQLMTFKWSEAAPFPSYRRIAERMNVSEKMVRRYAQGLEAKGYLFRFVRKNKTNLFDLSGLFNALKGAIQHEKRDLDRAVKLTTIRAEIYSHLQHAKEQTRGSLTVSKPKGEKKGVSS